MAVLRKDMLAGNFDAYIAGDRRRALASGEKMPDKVRGSAIFADISGFTPLTEALVSEQGQRRGAEELTAVLNAVFDAVLEELHRYGGSVIYFSGDAVTCWLDGDDGARGVACGLAMQRAMGQVADVTTPGGTSVRLAMKIAVVAGRARRFVVGDPTVQLIDVLAGDIMDRLAAAEHLARSGEVVVDGDTCARLADRLATSELRGDSPDRVAVVLRLRPEPSAPLRPLPYPRLPRAVVRQWLLPAVYERARAGRGEFLAELRPAVPVFVRFGGIDYDRDPDAHRKLDDFVRQVQQIVDSYGGNLLQLTLGDKGAYLYSVFGSPLAHEDDAARACAAALELVSLDGRTAAERVQVGLARGRLRSGSCGHWHRRTFCCLGDATNLAARLMSAAPPGEIFVSASVANAVGDAFDFEVLPDFNVKGKAAPVAARRLRAKASPLGLNPSRHVHPLLGRESELANLLTLAGRALAGNGQLVAISAEAGMGKSRLAEEVVAALRAKEVPVLIGAGVSVGMATSYLAWREIVAALLGTTARDGDVGGIGRALASVGPGLVGRLPLLGTVLGLAIEDNELTAALDPKVRKVSLESLVVDLVAARAKASPLVIVIEDCHWLDQLSVDLLDVVARKVAALPVLVLLTYRPGAFRPPQTGHSNVLHLHALDGESCRVLTRSRLEGLYGVGTALPEALVERLVDHAEGNPFYLEELVNYLHATGMSPSDDEASYVDLPESLTTLVLSRVDALAEASRRTLKVASVVGREFSVETLTGSYPELGTPRQVVASLRRLCTADLVVQERATTGPYAFKHAVIQEACYETLPFSLRALVHGRVGHYIEATEPASLDLVAHHFWHSQEEDKKREYLLRAGDAAEARYANDAAVSYFRRLASLPGNDDKGKVLTKLGRVLELQGAWGEAEKAYGEALALATLRCDPDEEAWARAHLAGPMRRQGRYDQATRELDAATKIFAQVGDAAGEGRVAHVRGVIANQRGLPGEAWLYFERSLEIRRAIGDRRAEATLLDNLSIAAAHQQRYDVAEQLSEQALDLRRQVADRWGVGVSEANMGMISYLRGDNAGARAHFEAALSAQLEVGDAFSVANARHNLANALRELGDPSAGAQYGEALRTYADMTDRRSLCLLYEDVAMLVAGDEPRAAVRLLGAADALRATIGSSRLDYEQQKLDLHLAGARSRLGPLATSEHEAGLALEDSAAQDLALGLASRTGKRAST